MPFMPAVRLNQRSGALRGGIRFSARGLFSDSLPPFSVLACSAVQSFGPLNVCCPNASDLVGARFKLLSAGAGSKHGDLCNEQIRDSNERSNLSCGFVRPSAIEDARRCCQKIHLRTSGFNFSVAPLPSSEGELSLYLAECIIKPNFSGVVCPVDKRHKSIAKRRAA